MNEGASNFEPEESVSLMLAERIAEGDFPSAVYLVAEGETAVFADALGDASREPERRPATLETIYDLASLTKPLVTGLLCAMFMERELLDPCAPVARYLSEFSAEDKREVTVRQLLTHTSGLPAWRPLYAITRGGPDGVLDVISRLPLEYEPGKRVVYSDLGFITLGLLLQRLSGSLLAKLARREIFEPLKLRRTYFNPALSLRTEVAACESAGNAYERETCSSEHGITSGSYWREKLIWGEVHDGNAHFLGGTAGHAGLFSTVRETFRLARQFLAGATSLLKPETCALFKENLTVGLEEARSFAWQLAATPLSAAGSKLPPDAFGHLGFTGTSCWVDPSTERVFVLLTNRTHARKLPFVNINSVRRRFHELSVGALDARRKEARD